MAGIAPATAAPGWLTASNIPRYTNHSLTKPFNGGNPEIAAAPSANSEAVHGIFRQSPPSWLISRVPVACSTDPAPRNKRPLNRPWFQTCNKPPAIANAPQAASPRAVATIANPTPIRMMPMFSTL